MRDMDTTKTSRVIDLLQQIGQLQALKANYIALENMAATVQSLTFDITELKSEIVQIVKELEGHR